MSNRDRNAVLVLVSVVFLGLGMLMASVGPMLPGLAQQTGTDLTVIGSVFSAVFLGTLLSHLASGPLGDRIGMTRVLMGGACLLAAGFLGISLSHWLPLMLAMGFIAGLGLGGVDLGGSLWVAATFPNDSVSKLNLLNVFFGVGALTGPALVSLSLVTFSIAYLPIWGAATMLALCVPFILRVSKAAQFQSAPRAAAQSNASEGGANQFGSTALLWILGFVLLLYVGTESGYGGWVTTYLVRTGPMRMEDAALAASLFWMAITAGRILISAIGSRVAPLRLLAFSIAGAAFGGWALVAVSGNIVLSFICIAVVGFCFAAFYPTVFAMIASSFSKAPGKAAGPATALGSMGGVLIPWVQGILLTSISPLAGMIFAAVNIVLIAGLLAVAGVLMRKRAIAA